VVPALLVGSAIAGDAQNLVPVLILLPTLEILLTLHPAREEFLRLHARIRARRGPQIATVATARKLATLAWHMLRTEQDYTYARPSLTRIKLRRLELRCGAAPLTGKRPAVRIYPTGPQRAAERAMLEQAEAGYLRLVSDWRSTRPRT
jgi:hypothetical protein